MNIRQKQIVSALEGFLSTGIFSAPEYPVPMTPARLLVILTALCAINLYPFGTIRTEQWLAVGVAVLAITGYLLATRDFKSDSWKEVTLLSLVFALTGPAILMMNYCESYYDTTKSILYVTGSLFVFAVLDWRMASIANAFGTGVGWGYYHFITGFDKAPVPPHSEINAITFCLLGATIVSVMSSRASKGHQRVAAQLVNVLAHELRTPLKALVMLSTRLQEDTHEQSETYQIAQRIQQTTKAIHANIDLQVQNANPLHSKERAKMEYADVKDLIEEAINRQFIANQHVARAISLREIDKNIVAFVNKDLFRSAIQNLLSNAVVSVTKRRLGGDPEMGDITISIRKEDEDIVIDILDRGIGIPRNHLKRIFDPFFSSTNMPATGLGLTMVKNSIEDMGGSVTVESELGKTAFFEIRLPKTN